MFAAGGAFGGGLIRFATFPGVPKVAWKFM